MMAAPTDLTSFVLGIVGGLVPTFIWQLGIAPARERFNLAKILRAEVQINLGRLIAAQVHRRKRGKGLLRDFLLTRAVMTAISGRVAELPAESVQLLIRFYQRLEYLTEVTRQLRSFEEEIEAGADGARLDQLLARSHHALRVIDEAIDLAIKLGEKLAGRLDDILSNHWLESPPRLLSVDALEAQAVESFERVAQAEAAFEARQLPPMSRF